MTDLTCLEYESLTKVEQIAYLQQIDQNILDGIYNHPALKAMRNVVRLFVEEYQSDFYLLDLQILEGVQPTKRR